MNDNVYHNHLDMCDQCRNNPFDMCPEGERTLLLQATGNDPGLKPAHHVPNPLDIMRIDMSKDEKVLMDKVIDDLGLGAVFSAIFGR